MTSPLASIASLENFVNVVRSPTNAKLLADTVRRSEDLLFRNLPLLDNVLGSLDAQEHSIGMCQVLAVKLVSANMTENNDSILALIGVTNQFLQAFDVDQIQSHAPDLLSNLCRNYVNLLVRRSSLALLGIRPLAEVIQRLAHNFQNNAGPYRSGEVELTSVHTCFAQLCLVAGNFKPALPVLDADITEIAKENGTYDVKEFLLYYYYGGLIYLALKRYARAHLFFEVVVTTPAVALSKITLETYKKFVLLSFLLHGKVSDLPRFTNQLVKRYIKPLTVPYQEFVSANSTRELVSILNKHSEFFQGEGNLGLAKQALKVHQKRDIQKLTKTFLTLSLPDIASQVNLPGGGAEAESYLLEMIEEGEISALIDHHPGSGEGMVKFLDSSSVNVYSENLLQELNSKIDNCIRLNSKLRLLDAELSTDSKYVKKSISTAVPEDEGGCILGSSSSMGLMSKHGFLPTS